MNTNHNHIIFFTQLYYPDMTTIAIIMTDLVEDLAAYGMNTKVVCAQPTYIKNSDPQITPVRSSGPTPVPSAGATGQAGQAQITRIDCENQMRDTQQFVGAKRRSRPSGAAGQFIDVNPLLGSVSL